MDADRNGLRAALYERLDDVGLAMYELAGDLRAGELGATRESDEDYYWDPSVVDGYADDRRGSTAAALLNAREKEWNNALLERDGYDLPDPYAGVLPWRDADADEPLTGVDVLDVGGGDGWVSAHFSGLGADTTYIDQSPEMAAAARENPEVTADRYVQGDATALPFPDDTFDYAVSNRVAHVIPDEAFPDYIAEMGRVATDGVVFDTFRGPSIRKGFNHLMPMWSTLRSDDEVRAAIDTVPTVERAGSDHAFTMPYVAYRSTDSRPGAAALAGANAAANTAGDILSSTENGWRSVSVWYLEPVP